MATPRTVRWSRAPTGIFTEQHEEGGAAPYGGKGTVFKITPEGTLTMLYSFCSNFPSCPDGSYPLAGVVQGTDGNFYGTTFLGGTDGDGTVFKINPSGALTTLHSVDVTDGLQPLVLVQGRDGNFYGTTYEGGANAYGTVFKITSSGTLTSLYSFCSEINRGICTDGSSPLGGLVQGTDGNFYGTTVVGGTGGCKYGCGTIFKITPSGTLITLHSFGGQNGSEPIAGLIQGTDGNFYGTTEYGGANDAGTVFTVSPSGTVTRLYSFSCSGSTCANGVFPGARLVQGTDGDFYGTADGGGANDYGTVFKITSSGTLTTVHSFAGPGDAYYFPYPGLIQGTDGTFYGVTPFSGTVNETCPLGCGTIFSLSVGLKPFLETEPTSGAVGTPVNILGSNLTGATSVTFNGTAAVFTVVSKTLITTTVPTGATTGTVQVVRPNGKGLSNVPFTVLP
jgi:uncharacterized repeat protein (TIGR03803 family)